MNKKGFTLIELLAAIMILGIITALAMPVLKNVREKNDMAKISTYSDSLTSSAKLYVESYGEDLFRRETSGCAYIKYSDLKEKMLVKDIQMDNVSCDSENTFIKVIKLNDQYSYTTYLGCGAKDESGVSEVTMSYPEKDKVYTINDSECGLSNSNITVTANSSSHKTFDQKQFKTWIQINSATGINSTYVVNYAWSQSTNVSAITDWRRLKFSIPSVEYQKSRILSSQPVIINSEELSTPDNGDGSYYLYVKITGLLDLSGNSWHNTDNPGQDYVSFGPYNVDNTHPIISNVNISSASSGFNSLKTKVAIDASDSHVSKGNLKYCISTSSANCPASSYKSYSPSYSFDFTGGYDGKTRTLYVSVKDLAGNVTKGSYRYSVYKECSSKKASDIWVDVGTCSKSCGQGTVPQVADAVDSYTLAKCSGQFSRDGYCFLNPCKPPRPQILNPREGMWVNSHVTLNASSPAVASEIMKWYYSIDNETPIEFGGPQMTSVDLTLLREGRNDVEVWLCNWKAHSPTDTNNCSDHATTTIRIDRTPPTIHSYTIESEATGINSLDIIVDIDASDSGSGIREYCVSEKNSGHFNCSSKPHINYTLSGELDGGDREIVLTVKDNVLNEVSENYTYRTYKKCSSKITTVTSTSECSCETQTQTQYLDVRDRYLGSVCSESNTREISCTPSNCS